MKLIYAQPLELDFSRRRVAGHPVQESRKLLNKKGGVLVGGAG